MADSESTHSGLRQRLFEGGVIPAHPLALDRRRLFDPRRQRALSRYYLDAGSAGLAVGVHTTQFEIRNPEHDLLGPVLRLAAEEMASFEQSRGKKLIKVAGIVGDRKQALAEAGLARELGYDAGLLSLAALSAAPNDELLEHCRAVARILPLFGFYLQPAVGGRRLDYSFWRKFFEIETAVAVKIAPFNRYYTLDVVRALVDSGREKEISLYTGNDDQILADLLTEFVFQRAGEPVPVRFRGGLLGHWAVWTRAAVELFERIREPARRRAPVPAEWLTLGAQIIDCNAALFDVAHDFRGCIVGLHEILRRQGLLEVNWTLDAGIELSPEQSHEIDRISAAYPHLQDDDFVARNLPRWLS